VATRPDAIQRPDRETEPWHLGIFNPDPDTWIWLFVHTFVGMANLARDPGLGVLAVDDRFPRLTMPQFAGLSLAPGNTEQLDFSIVVPRVDPGNYLGNSFLFQSTWHDPGQYLDRSLFVFEVV
jgi:hypothetical protein